MKIKKEVKNYLWNNRNQMSYGISIAEIWEPTLSHSTINVIQSDQPPNFQFQISIRRNWSFPALVS